MAFNNQHIMTNITDFIANSDALYYLLIPLVSAFVGCVTNALGIQMMFKPLDFVGVKPVFGWQGIIPARAKKFAALQMDQVEGLVDIKEVLDRVDAQEISDILQPNLKLLVESIMNEVGMQYSAIFWENLPGFAKNRIYS
ncbi:MAG: hypothetical protein MI867_07100, partial [Pseudomonadales bacterium]|nr:hypothetical protein [Pseudomonadales bacterium]